MGQSQSTFLEEFRRSFSVRSGIDVTWAGGQAGYNTGALPMDRNIRRPLHDRKGERFELGDMTATVGAWRVVVEFDGGAVMLSNLLKYWPYIRGELSSIPETPLLLCHFSDWWSYAAYRDLWQWTLGRMKCDPGRVVDLEGKQFDHWDDDRMRRGESVAAAVDWIIQITGTTIR